MSLKRKRQVGIKIEATEGTLDTPTTAAEHSHLIYEPMAEDDLRIFERDPARADLSGLEHIVGISTRGQRFRTEMRGSGSVNTAPKWGTHLRACGMRQEQLRFVNIGAITGGPFLQGETITGGTSAATGIVHQTTATGAGTIQYVRTSVATFTNGETITGGTSGATATTSTAEANYGWRWRPWSTDPDTATLNSNVLGPGSASLSIMEDGVRKLARGARGTVRGTMQVGEPGFFEFDYRGVEAGTTDTALVTGLTYDTTIPPKFQGSNILTIALEDATAPVNPCITSFSFAVENELAERECANDAEGVTSVKIPSRKLTGTVNPEMVSVATFPWHAKAKAGTVHRITITLGTVAGNIIDIILERVQFMTPKEADRNGIDTLDVDFRAIKDQVNSSGDDELFLVMR